MKSWWIIRFVLLGVVYALVMSLVVMSLWNYLAPDLFHAPVINIWQALALLVLAKVLFGGFGRGQWASKMQAARKMSWKKNFDKKWSNMTAEEKAEFKNKFRNRCGNWYQQEPETPVREEVEKE